jgi:hypothetical protein
VGDNALTRENFLGAPGADAHARIRRALASSWEGCTRRANEGAQEHVKEEFARRFSFLYFCGGARRVSARWMSPALRKPTNQA